MRIIGYERVSTARQGASGLGIEAQRQAIDGFELAEFTNRRKRAYEQLHPEAANGAIGNGRGKVRQVGEATCSGEIKRFTADTAARTGQSERAVQRDAERGAKVCSSALALVNGTELDTARDANWVGRR
jgi:hypothetical protein